MGAKEVWIGISVAIIIILVVVIVVVLTSSHYRERMLKMFRSRDLSPPTPSSSGFVPFNYTASTEVDYNIISNASTNLPGVNMTGASNFQDCAIFCTRAGAEMYEYNNAICSIKILEEVPNSSTYMRIKDTNEFQQHTGLVFEEFTGTSGSRDAVLKACMDDPACFAVSSIGDRAKKYNYVRTPGSFIGYRS